MREQKIMREQKPLTNSELDSAINTICHAISLVLPSSKPAADQLNGHLTHLLEEQRQRLKIQAQPEIEDSN